MKEQPSKYAPVAVIGGGTMGTALAQLIAEKGHPVKLWVYEAGLVDAINTKRENSLFLPGIRLSDGIEATGSLENCLSGTDFVLSVTPSQVLRSVWTEAKAYLADRATIVCCSKGIETHSGMLMSGVFEEVLGSSSANRVAFLSGPSFAREILAGHPTAVVVACANHDLACDVQQLISTPTFRAYTTDDVVGVELGGSLKNVIAIGVGVAEGLGLGINTRSALITRGLAEITRLASECGGQPQTLSGLAGMGDLVLTCTGHLSRNLQVGIRLGQGETLGDILASMKMVAEGVATAYSALQLAKTVGVEMPITETVVRLLDGTSSPATEVASLMGRRLRAEKDI